MRPTVQILAVSAVAVIGLGAAFSVSESMSDSDSPAPKAPSVASPAVTEKVTAERDDLNYLRLEDRSDGFADVRLFWSITNNSSEKSDYEWDWEAVDTRTGKRVDNSTEFESDVRPGQTATGDMYTMLNTVDHIKINVTEFNRTKAY